jgi:hypothetical protein
MTQNYNNYFDVIHGKINYFLFYNNYFNVIHIFATVRISNGYN